MGLAILAPQGFPEIPTTLLEYTSHDLRRALPLVLGLWRKAKLLSTAKFIQTLPSGQHQKTRRVPFHIFYLKARSRVGVQAFGGIRGARKRAL
ncbi:hypothetical protein O181_006801 [Austropuccinia psidii MF-1]|uniref:Uncharacterized protein n=1 Tax=Austropuccinia psidii MF-1 TaxID=1389203 RepID=A0A9Q3BJQ5_9BASI|nr:hypothetical protein [Austropuccinia psidii MF-1]